MKHALVGLAVTLAICLDTSRATAFDEDFLPNRDYTEGSVREDLSTVCIEQTRMHRHTTRSMKERVYRRYGIYHRSTGEYQIDHLVPLCLGGADSEDNLWPQSYHVFWNARHKDRLEQTICRMVCWGGYDLREAQRKIRDNWIAFYREVFGGDANPDPDEYSDEETACSMFTTDCSDDDCE